MYKYSPLQLAAVFSLEQYYRYGLLKSHEGFSDFLKCDIISCTSL